MQLSDEAIPGYYTVRIPVRCVSEHSITERSLIIESGLNALDDYSLVEFGKRIPRGKGEPSKCVSIKLSPFAASRIGHIRSGNSHFSVSALVSNLLSS